MISDHHDYRADTRGAFFWVTQALLLLPRVAGVLTRRRGYVRRGAPTFASRPKPRAVDREPLPALAGGLAVRRIHSLPLSDL